MRMVLQDDLVDPDLPRPASFPANSLLLDLRTRKLTSLTQQEVQLLIRLMQREQHTIVDLACAAKPLEQL